MSIETIREHLRSIASRAPLSSPDYVDADDALAELADLEIEVRNQLPIGVIAKARAAVQEDA